MPYRNRRRFESKNFGQIQLSRSFNITCGIEESTRWHLRGGINLANSAGITVNNIFF